MRCPRLARTIGQEDLPADGELPRLAGLQDAAAVLQRRWPRWERQRTLGVACSCRRCLASVIREPPQAETPAAPAVTKVQT